MNSQQQISVTVVTEFVCWNEEAISRCTLFSSQPATLAANVRSVFTCLLDQVSLYITEGLERARDSLTEAAALRERFVLGASVSRRVAAAAASAAEAAAAAGESSFKSFMVAVQRCGSSVAIVQQYFANSISRLLLPVDGAHAASCEEMATAMSSAEGAAYKGLQQCIETVMAEGNRLHKGLMNHWQKFTFNPSGGLRLKRDITEYGEFVRSFNAPTVDEKFELLGILANVFIVAPESLSTLFEGIDAASQKRELSTMAECAKILSQLNRGSSAMQHYVGLRPMFDLEVMNEDARLVLGGPRSQPSPSNVARELSSLYKEITDTVRKEAAIITAVFPSPNDVVSILVQRVLEDRIPNLLEKPLVKLSLLNPPQMEDGGLVLYLRLLAVAYEKTQDLASDLRGLGCGGLDVEGCE